MPKNMGRIPNGIVGNEFIRSGHVFYGSMNYRMDPESDREREQK